ncbi:hypothetical protein [uncultured Nitratireductor sp.]|uniref:hypothetical protein n=1 Tax=uncultured Nitratireductor sp. TaxID=520953 RepID=UPI0025DB07CB|nr:hypothetical protein [uncultured Nitratireductor sp.]MEC9246275.1 hypothetical protein [Pseudomonadota bacterium]
MANPNRGAVALETEDKVYSLRFSTNAICELEEHFGKPIMQIVNELEDESRVSMGMIRSIVWAALLEHDPEITHKEAGRVLDHAGQQVVMEKIGLALQRFFPDAGAEKGKANPPKAKAE